MAMKTNPYWFFWFILTLAVVVFATESQANCNTVIHPSGDTYTSCSDGKVWTTQQITPQLREIRRWDTGEVVRQHDYDTIIITESPDELTVLPLPKINGNWD